MVLPQDPSTDQSFERTGLLEVDRVVVLDGLQVALLLHRAPAQRLDLLLPRAQGLLVLLPHLRVP